MVARFTGWRVQDCHRIVAARTWLDLKLEVKVVHHLVE